MSNLLNHARTELRLAGHDLDGPVASSVLALMKVFADQGHSGMSASFARGLFLDFARHRPVDDIRAYTAARCAAERVTVNGDPVDHYVDSIVQSAQDLVRIFLTRYRDEASATQTVDLFALLADFQPASPLTGQDDEWCDISDSWGGNPAWQNKRCSRVFKDNGNVYDIEGKIFREPDGNCFVSGDSRVPVTFPYTPVREYVDVPASR